MLVFIMENGLALDRLSNQSVISYRKKSTNFILKIKFSIDFFTDPATGKIIAEVTTGTVEDYDECVKAAVDAYKTWSNIPAPRRGEIVRQIGDELRKYLEPLGKLVSLGKY